MTRKRPPTKDDPTRQDEVDNNKRVDSERLKPHSTTRALPVESIAFSLAVTREEAARASRRLARTRNYSKAIVVALDMRESTTFMLHVEDFDDYAANLANFVTFVKFAANDKGGWFDKFTGDGALLFWLVPPEGLSNRLLFKVLDFSINVQTQFIDTTVPGFRAVAGCIPARFGLSIGIDYGRCLVSDLTPMPGLMVSGKEVTTPPVQGATVLGRAIVGAVRMVNAAKEHEILLNEGPGEFLVRVLGRTPTNLISVEKVLVDNKDLRGKQFAYRVVSTVVQEAVSKHYGVTGLSQLEPRP